MSKFYGKVGYGITTEKVDENNEPTGVWEDTIVERDYYGDVIQNLTRWQTATTLNDNLNISNKISILADAYAYQHFSVIKYVEWMSQLWKVTDISVERPRLILSIGGVYSEQKD